MKLSVKGGPISWDEESALDKLIRSDGLWEGDYLRDYGPEYNYQMTHSPDRAKVSNMTFPIVLSGASGVGKTVLSKLVLEASSNMVESISCTTRAARPGEEPERDYIFMDAETFSKRAANDEFIEWAEVHGEYYGTPLDWMEERLKEHTNVLSVLDVQGGQQLIGKLPEACLIFLVPPNMKELERRLIKRDADTKEVIAKRLVTAEKEHQIGLANYEYVVVNEQIEIALADVLGCIRAHRLKRSDIRMKGISWEQ